MSVIGTGVDLVHVPSFAEQWRMPGTRFEQVFTPREIADCGGGNTDQQLASLAARWAAKEALIKAWSESLWGTAPVAEQEVHALIEVVQDAWSRPRLVLHREVRDSLADVQTFVSLSHDHDHATAYVTLEDHGNVRPLRPGNFDSWPWSQATYVDRLLA